MKNVIKGILGLIVMVLLSACGPDTTKELVVFEENIGIPNDVFGLYKKDKENVVLFLYYQNGKFHLMYNGKSDTQEYLLYGNFVPSKVSGTKDYYILSFSNAMIQYYNIKQHTKQYTPLIRSGNHLLLYLKKESDNLMIWDEMIGDNCVKLEGSALKEAIKATYKKTFTNTPNFFKLEVDSKQLGDDIDRTIQQAIKDKKEKYKNYMPKDEYDRLEKEKEVKKKRKENEDNIKQEKYGCDIKDDSESCKKYAYRLLKGDGVSKDTEQSKKYFRKSCEYSNDNGEWCSSIGKSYYYANNGFEKNYKESLIYFKHACYEGIGKACKFLGYQYRGGKGTAKDMSRAFEAFKRSCERDDGQGCFYLGYGYLKGEGTYKDREKASKYFKKSCNLGDEDGCKGYKGLQKETEKCGSQMTDKINSLIDKGNRQYKSSITIFNGANISLDVYEDIKIVLKECYQSTYDKEVEKLIIKTNKKIDIMNDYYRQVIQNGKQIAKSEDVVSGFFNAAIGISTGKEHYDKANSYKTDVMKLIQEVANKTPY